MYESCMLVRFRFKFGDPRLEWKDILADNWKRLEEIETWLTHLASLGFYSSRLLGWHFNKIGRSWVCNFTFCRLYAVPHASKWKIILLLKQKHENMIAPYRDWPQARTQSPIVADLIIIWFEPEWRKTKKTEKDQKEKKRRWYNYLHLLERKECDENCNILIQL